MRAIPLLLAAVLTGCSATVPAPQNPVPDDQPSASTAAAWTAPVAPSAAPAARPLPPWGIRRIGPGLRAELQGRNWHPGCPVPLEDLREVTVHYVGFDGQVRAGPLVVHERVAEDVLWVFRRLFHERFRIKHVALAHRWRPTRPEDYFTTRSVTAAFNCRPVTNGTSFSQHSFGWAIDINPLQNPYVGGDGTVLRRAAKAYVDRSQDLTGMIHPDDVVVRAFGRIGWEWGGDWVTLKDYMHFSLTGR